MVLATDLSVLVLERQLSNEQTIRVLLGLLRVLQLCPRRIVEVDPQERPLPLRSRRHTLDRAHMKRHECPRIVVWHEYRVMLLIHVQQARLDVLGDLLGRLVGLDLVHLLHLVFLRGALDLVALEPAS
jgi:hypothetical protein